LNVTVTNICILGGAGAGKSALINSILSSEKGRRVQIALSQIGAHVTTSVDFYPLQNKNIRLWDA